MIGGMLVAAQGPIYARLSEGLNGDSLAAVFLAFLSATVVTGLLVLGVGNWRSISGLARLPYWVWLGGLLGACHVVISMHAIPLVGISMFLVLVISGNLIGSAIYDHFGAFGLVSRPFNVLRLAGLVIVLVGVLVTLRA
jgi:transporter family-2 protein